MDTTELPDIAQRIIDQQRAHGFDPDNGESQILALMEEAGEIVGAYRRWTGRARRAGSPEELQAELADIIITSHIVAIVLGYELTTVPLRLMYAVEPNDAWPHVMGIFHEVSALGERWNAGIDVRTELDHVVLAACQLADVLHIELPAAIEAKLEIVFSRGWREVPA